MPAVLFGRITFTHRLEAGQSPAAAAGRYLEGAKLPKRPPVPSVGRHRGAVPGLLRHPHPKSRRFSRGFAGRQRRGTERGWPGAARGDQGPLRGWREVPGPGVSCSTPGTRGRAGSALGPGRGERQELRGCTERKRALQSRRLPSPGIFLNSSGSSIITVVLLLLSRLY